MTTLIRTFACLTSFSLTVLLAGCGELTPPSGKQCTIQFRRDALGTGASLPVSPMVNSQNGAETSISGTLKSATGQWVVLDYAGSEVWIPKSAVLLIKY